MKAGNLKIKQVAHKNDFKLQIIFSDNKSRIIDFKIFSTKSQHPEIRKYLNQGRFKKFKLVDGDLMWGGFDLIFPISDLYDGKISAKD